MNNTFLSTPALLGAGYNANNSTREYFSDIAAPTNHNSIRQSLYGAPATTKYNNVATVHNNTHQNHHTEEEDDEETHQDETSAAQYYAKTQPYVNGKIPTHRGDMVLLPEMAWSVPMPRAPVCTTFGQKPLVQPLYENSKLLLGTPIDEDTSVGTIMPKFQYKEYINMQM